jgi:hypothetical protein
MFINKYLTNANICKSLNIFGETKFNKDHNSAKQLWSGVPVNIKRFLDLI